MDSRHRYDASLGRAWAQSAADLQQFSIAWTTDYFLEATLRVASKK